METGKPKCQINRPFPPKTSRIQEVIGKDWTVDLKPINILSWQSGRSLETRMAAIARSGGICERCKENPVANIHHKVRMKTKKPLPVDQAFALGIFPVVDDVNSHG